MIAPDKIKEVQKQLRSGVPEGEIKNNLIKEGFTQDEIDSIFIAHKYNMRSWYLIFAIIFLIAAICLMPQNVGLWLVVFSAIMFNQYYVANKKWEK